MRSEAEGERAIGARPWDELGRERLADYGIFRVDRLRLRSPRNGQVFDRHILDLPDWVNVVPFTEDGRVVLVEQYRFGSGTMSLEFPAGTLDPGEAPEDGGRRELREETGYVPGTLERVASLHPDPAIQGNVLHVLAARDCRLAGPSDQDDGEDVHTRVVSPDEVRGMIADGRIHHALAVAVWYVMETARPGLRGG